jgi:hypothetical protein
MSHFAIWEVSTFLKRLLVDGLAEHPETAIADANLLLSNPGQAGAGAGQKRLFLWLYQVMQNEHMRNDAFVRQAKDEEERFPPLVVNLQYLLTPSTGQDLTDQLVLGKAMQVLYDNAVIRMESPNDPTRAEELHLALAARTMDELAEVWEAMQQPYRLSVCYDVRVVRIDSLRVLTAGRVANRSARFEPMPEGA